MNNLQLVVSLFDIGEMFLMRAQRSVSKRFDAEANTIIPELSFEKRSLDMEATPVAGVVRKLPESSLENIIAIDIEKNKIRDETKCSPFFRQVCDEIMNEKKYLISRSANKLQYTISDDDFGGKCDRLFVNSASTTQIGG